MATGDFLDISQRALRLARRDDSIAAQVTLAKEAVNEGYAEVLASSDDWEFLRREGTVTLAANTDTRTYTQFASDLTLGSDSIEEILYFADDTNGWVLESLSWGALENMALTTQYGSATQASQMRWWAQSADRTCRFFPRPAVATSLRIHYRLKDALMSLDADLPVIPTGFAASMLEHYAAWKLLLQDSGGEGMVEGANHRAIFEAKLAALKKAYGTARTPIMGLVEPGAFWDLPDTLPGNYFF